MPSANGGVVSSSPGKGRMCSRLLAPQRSSQSSPQQKEAAWQPTAARAAAEAGAAAAISSRQKDHTVINVNTKIVVLIKGNTQKHKRKHLKNGAITI